MELTDKWMGWHVVLASASPRRRELLGQIGIEPEIRPSRMEESSEESSPEGLVMELSRQKAEEVASGCSQGTMVIGADTVVAAEGEILGKPGTPERAVRMIERLQGRSHQVYTGVTVLLCLGGGRTHGITFAECTDVHVYPMTEGEINEYASCGEPLDKAELSRQKAEEVASGCSQGTMVIGADTVVAAEGEILGKPGTPERAVRMIERLQGRSHQVYTGVTVLLCLGGGRTHGITFAECTDVHVYPMTEGEINEYASCGEPLDKAGAYGIQGRFAAYIKGIDGDYSNVVGLPLGRLCQEIKGLLEEQKND